MNKNENNVNPPILVNKLIEVMKNRPTKIDSNNKDIDLVSLAKNLAKRREAKLKNNK